MTNIMNSFGFLSFKLGEALEENLEKYISEKYQMKSREVGIMIAVKEKKLSQIQIGQILKLDKNSVRFFIDGLEERNYVYREKNPENRRENLICLTEQGRDLAEELSKTLSISENEVLNVLSLEEKELLKSILKKVYENRG
ncbi:MULTISPECIES: MarR family winged helix-turn-helix transcriptional regulator [unclassified Lysinibacillus]|uniref:MarR family winged helix-turn-helix transcriptional regulator n=1 Tax=unclassified Lysinibacillus TaxID=2636778 RepID=UPI00104A2399|nr:MULTISPECIES: MarR family transcriptional regulator [unclassified Lysinibacillus]MDD1501822.1 MarR family transcriptional regulator [Lysinibacillus sp. CNPSo 3705]UPW83932.1 MarR family transcriptional regulator [Lysinibacillus sp. Ag94]